jgi:hypothetical protein
MIFRPFLDSVTFASGVFAAVRSRETIATPRESSFRAALRSRRVES